MTKLAEQRRDHRQLHFSWTELRDDTTGKHVGDTIYYDWQPYQLVGRIPYLTKRGEKSVVHAWQSVCPDCGRPFVTTTGRVFQRVQPPLP